ncbi:hypothetical protein IQ246_24445 [aff. Roholtiella sp. LEGE 12411]|nr:hypothetical protein [aff. Roholtiella sp. LEGE 12411]
MHRACRIPTGKQTTRSVSQVKYPQFPMPNAQCPIPNSQCPMPNSQFP